MMEKGSSILFNNMSLPHSRSSFESFTSPRLRTQALERIKRYFEDCKQQINNRLAGIGQDYERRRESVQGIRMKIAMLHHFLGSLNIYLLAPFALRQVPIRLTQHLLEALQCKGASGYSL